MARLTAVSRERHADRRWQQYRTYDFARGFSLCALVLAEIEEVALALPYGFIQRQDVLAPVAILGRAAGECLYIGAQGNWVGGYVPAILRGYPFRLLKTDDGRLVLHIDEGSGVVVNSQAEGEPFFEHDRPSPALQEVQTFLETLEASRQQTARACALLQELGLVMDWPSEDDTGGQALAHPAPIPGLLRIDTAALDRLDGEALARLQRCGGLRLAFYQTLSERHLAVQRVLDKAQQQQRQAARDESKADNYFEDENATLSFAWED